MICSLLLPLFLLSLSSFGGGQLIAYPAWIDENNLDEYTGVTLENGMRFCPDDLSKKGFNIFCIPDGESKKVDFYADDELLIRDRREPYFMIRNTRGGRVRPWREWMDYEGEVVIRCTQLRGRRRVTSEIEVELTLSCEEGDPGPDAEEEATKEKMMQEEMHEGSRGEEEDKTNENSMPSPSPSAVTDPMMEEAIDGSMDMTPEGLPQLVLKPAGAKKDGEEGTVLTDGMKLCPAVAFKFGEFNVECVGAADYKYAEFYVDGALVRKESRAPYFIAGDSAERVHPWTTYPTDTGFELRCDVTEKATGMVSSRSVMVSFSCDEVFAQGVKTTTDGCVVIDAKFTRLSKGWEEMEEGVGFRTESTDLGIAGPGSFPLVYKFTAPVTSQYGFVVDMTTKHRVEHNDVYAEFEQVGFQLMRGGAVYHDAKNEHGVNWIKVYHNSNGRDTVSNSVDFKPHSISTREALHADTEYTLKLAGRSTMVVIHRIILFPCSATACEKSSSTWKKNLNTCKKITADN